MVQFGLGQSKTARSRSRSTPRRASRSPHRLTRANIEQTAMPRTLQGPAIDERALPQRAPVVWAEVVQRKGAVTHADERDLTAVDVNDGRSARRRPSTQATWT
jgi:hypothetical protein